jgi:hypothetical protein
MDVKSFRGFIVFAALVSIFLAATGCSSEMKNEKVTEFESFRNEYQLAQETAEWLEVFNCCGIAIYDSLLVAVEWGGERVFHVYNLNTKQLAGTFGRFGKGPGEFFSCPDFTSVYFLEGSDLIIQIFDVGRMTLKNINLSQSVKTHSLVLQDDYILPELGPVSNPFMTPDSLVFYAAGDILISVNRKTGDTVRLNKPVVITQNLPSSFNDYVREMHIEPALQSDRIVGAYYFLKRLNIYNGRGELMRVIKEKGDHAFDTSDSDIYKANNLVFFSKVFLSDKYILCLNQNRKAGVDKSGELWLFSYEGKALNKYRLDSWIHYGAVDWKAKRFYSYNYKEKTMISFALEGIPE